MVRVMVIFGGRSGEHEVSLASARAIMGALREGGRHEVVPVGITREGAWVHAGDPMRELEGRAGAPTDGQAAGSSTVAASDRLPPDLFGEVDVVFPVLHGPFGEDGTVQGMLELLGVPYVGSGVLASAAAMDKVTMKKVFAYHGLPQVRWLGLTREEWQGDRDRWKGDIEGTLGYPCFVKPSNLGSSVGINRADNAEELQHTLDSPVLPVRSVQDGEDDVGLVEEVRGDPVRSRHGGALDGLLVAPGPRPVFELAHGIISVDPRSFARDPDGDYVVPAPLSEGANDGAGRGEGDLVLSTPPTEDHHNPDHCATPPILETRPS